jgi:DNA-binding SARP family transcriptional activator
MIRTYVSRLRRNLDKPGEGAGKSLIATIGGGYAFTASPDALDLAVFQQEAAAGDAARRAGDLSRAAAHLREALCGVARRWPASPGPSRRRNGPDWSCCAWAR